MIKYHEEGKIPLDININQDYCDVMKIDKTYNYFLSHLYTHSDNNQWVGQYDETRPLKFPLRTLYTNDNNQLSSRILLPFEQIGIWIRLRLDMKKLMYVPMEYNKLNLYQYYQKIMNPIYILRW